jgi:hypothetical protein
MADALEVVATVDTIVSIDVTEIHIEPPVSGSTPLIRYSLLVTWSSGRTEVRSKVVKPTDFVACLASFCQATPKRKLLTWLVSAGYETNLTIQ